MFYEIIKIFMKIFSPVDLIKAGVWVFDIFMENCINFENHAHKSE